MIYIKVTPSLLLANTILICSGMFMTPEQARNDDIHRTQMHIGTGIGPRTDMFNRDNPNDLLRGFFPFLSVFLICVALMFLTLALFGLIGYLLGCRRPSLEELNSNEFDRITPDEEYLLGMGNMLNLNDAKLPIQNLSNGAVNNNPKDFSYEPLIQTERALIGQSHEDMV